MFRSLAQPVLRAYGQLPPPVKRFLVRRATPSFTAGAVTLVERSDGRLLLARLSYLSGWGLPGGHLKRREPAAAAAVRETREEVGLEVILQGDPAVLVDPILRRVDHVYWAKPAPGVDPDCAAPKSVEIAEVGWFPTDNLPSVNWMTRATLWAVADTWCKLGGDVPPWSADLARQVVKPAEGLEGGRAVAPRWPEVGGWSPHIRKRQPQT